VLFQVKLETQPTLHIVGDLLANITARNGGSRSWNNATTQFIAGANDNWRLIAFIIG
jgi:hypothetical protein